MLAIKRINILADYKQLSVHQLIALVSLFLVLSGNRYFFINTLSVYPLSVDNVLFLLSLIIINGCVGIIALSLFGFRFALKPVLIGVLLISSIMSYFTDIYHIVIDDVMINNVLMTNMSEALDLLSWRFFAYLLVLGVMPSIIVYKIQIAASTDTRLLLSKIIWIISAGLTIIFMIMLLGGHYASFIREHKSLRHYSIPYYPAYSLVKFMRSAINNEPVAHIKIALDAQKKHSEKRRLIVLVVGETARADHWALNGYERNTTPLLDKQNVINFSNTWACGTSTAVSVPCLFSSRERSGFNLDQARHTDNLLDIIKRVGDQVLWLDNNSDSKSVADRVEYIDYKSSDTNPECDIECRDTGMLSGLDAYLDKHKKGDVFIVLHQMGNHGPAYYKRYPEAFEKFTPVCKTNLLDACSSQEIINAYDNALLYTDYFLSSTIDWLKNQTDQFSTGMIYISDHGESLGENGLYLHGYPYMLAPDSQKHIPFVMWFDEDFANKQSIRIENLHALKSESFSHDHIFHSLLRLMGIRTSLYDEQLDIFKQ